MARKTHGRTASGVPVTDDLLENFASRAESGYDVDETLRRRGGRPTPGLGPIGHVQLPPQEDTMIVPTGERQMTEVSTKHG